MSLRDWVSRRRRAVRTRHIHDYEVSGPEGAETYSCWCGYRFTRVRRPQDPRPPVGKAF